jgi:hypothetical protein
MQAEATASASLWDSEQQWHFLSARDTMVPQWR